MLRVCRFPGEEHRLKEKTGLAWTPRIGGTEECRTVAFYAAATYFQRVISSTAFRFALNTSSFSLPSPPKCSSRASRLIAHRARAFPQFSVTCAEAGTERRALLSSSIFCEPVDCVACDLICWFDFSSFVFSGFGESLLAAHHTEGVGPRDREEKRKVWRVQVGTARTSE